MNQVLKTEKSLPHQRRHRHGGQGLVPSAEHQNRVLEKMRPMDHQPMERLPALGPLRQPAAGQTPVPRPRAHGPRHPTTDDRQSALQTGGLPWSPGAVPPAQVTVPGQPAPSSTRGLVTAVAARKKKLPIKKGGFYEIAGRRQVCAYRGKVDGWRRPCLLCRLRRNSSLLERRR